MATSASCATIRRRAGTVQEGWRGPLLQGCRQVTSEAEVGDHRSKPRGAHVPLPFTPKPSRSPLDAACWRCSLCLWP